LKVLAEGRKLDESLILGPTSKYVVDKNARDFSRRQDIIHPSEMSHGDWCPRATYQRIKKVRAGELPDKESFNFQSLNIFQHGHEVHHKWQTWLWERGELWGDWYCLNCEIEWTDLSPQRCPDCNSRHIRYDEIPLNAEKQLLISGSADGGVPRHQALMEFKTVGAGTLRMEEPELLRAHTHKTDDGKSLIDYEGLWRGINRPFSSHQKQGQTYLYICKLLGLDYDKVVYIYESKFTQATKEFVVKRRESIIEPLLESAEEIRQALDPTFRAMPPKCPRGGCKYCQPKEETTSEESPAAARRRGTAGRGTEDGTTARRPGTGLRREAPRRSPRAS
jgi:hypothetical protein